MKALVLAAGVGSRLGSLTENIPKPMLPLMGKPVLEWNLKWLLRHGVNEIAINTHYLPEAIERHFGDRYGLAAIRYSYEPRLLGTAGALLPLREYLATDTFAIIFGDNLSTCNLGLMTARHRELNAVASLALWQRKDVSASGVVAFDIHNRITRFVEKPRAEEAPSNWVNAGIIVAEPEIFDFIPTAPPSDLGRDVFPFLLAQGGEMYAHLMQGKERLWWIDTPDDLARTAREFRPTEQ